MQVAVTFIPMILRRCNREVAKIRLKTLLGVYRTPPPPTPPGLSSLPGLESQERSKIAHYRFNSKFMEGIKMALLIPRAPECTIIEYQAVILTHRISPSQDKNCPCHRQSVFLTMLIYIQCSQNVMMMEIIE